MPILEENNTEEFERPLLSSPGAPRHPEDIRQYILSMANSPNDDSNHDDEPTLPGTRMPSTSTQPNDHHQHQSWYQNPYQVTAMISNFSTSYNVVNISLVLPILEQIHKDASSEDAAASASSLLAGMIVGQLVGGALGDSWLGRLGALRLVMSLQILASVASSFLGVRSASTHEDIYLRLAILRFILGVGCGGVYPLAAVLSAEQVKEDVGAATTPLGQNTGTTDETNQGKDDSDSVHRVVLTFSCQGLGFVTVPIVTVILLYCTTNLNIIWRLILGLGAFPGILLFFLQYRLYSRSSHGHDQIPVEDPLSPDHPEGDGTDSELENDSILASEPDVMDRIFRGDGYQPDEIIQDHHVNGAWLQSLLHEPGLGRKVLGTAGTWFLFDVVFYGNTIFQPIVVEAAFGGSSKGSGIDLLRKAAMDSLILTSIALPGYGVADAIMGKKTYCVTQTPRYVMLQGFACMGVLYAAIGLNWSYLRGVPALLVVLYGMTFFFANYGPNTSTFILPALLFEKEHRATWNGVSAAAGKLGALTGATLFEPAADAFGDSSVMLICAGVAIAAYILTYCAVPSQEKEATTPEDPVVDDSVPGEVA